MQGAYLEVSQAEQEATSTDTSLSNRPKNISETGYSICLNARSIVNKKNELNIMIEDTRGEQVLDIVLSSQKELVDNVKILEPLGNSDHNQIHFDINVKS